MSLAHEGGGSETVRGHRGQTAILGLVLLIGVVTVASVGILLVAGETTTELQTESEVERVEAAFVELRSELETAAATDDTGRTMDLAFDTEVGGVERLENGQLDVLVDGNSILGPNASSPVPLQSLAYRGSDGDRVAYQGGGVWRGSGNETTRVSAPGVHYRDGTLNLPVTTLDGSANPAEAFDIQNAGSEMFGRYVAGENVTLAVTTPYYGGWSEHFDQTFDEGDVEVIDEDRGYDGAKTVVANLHSVESIEQGTIEAGVIAANGFDAADGASGATIKSDIEAASIDCGQSATAGPPGSAVSCPYQTGSYDATILDEYPFTSNDERIENAISEAKQSGTDLGAIRGGELLDGSAYYADSIDVSSGTITVDLGTGDVVLAVEGDVKIDAGHRAVEIVNATGTDHRFELYVGGEDVLLSGQTEVCVESCNGKGSGANWLYGASHTTVEFNSADTTFEGVVSVPNDQDAGSRPYDGDYDIEISGEPTVTGALIGDNIHFEGGPSTKIAFDEDLTGLRPDGGSETSDASAGGVTYVHVTVHDLELHDE